MELFVVAIGVFAAASCSQFNGSAESCASTTDLTAKIAGRIYVLPAKDKPHPVPSHEADVVTLGPGERQDEDLLYCQRKGKVPVELEELNLKPASLHPAVIQFTISNVQRENIVLPSIDESTESPWIMTANRVSKHYQDFKLGIGSHVLRTSCTPEGARDVSGQVLKPMCDMRVRLLPRGALRLQYNRPENPADARNILIRTKKYLQALEVKK